MICHSLDQAIFADDVGARLKAKTWALGNCDDAVLRDSCVAIELRLEIEIAPLHHCTGATKSRVCVHDGKQARTVIEGMDPHSGVVAVRHREDLAQFCKAAHFGGAWLDEVDRLRV